MAVSVDRTYIAGIRNQSQVAESLDTAGFAAAKLWNVARWTAGRIWDETGQIPGDSVLKAYLKGRGHYVDLHSQSSQRVLEELDEAFTNWYGHRGNRNETANPPGYRKRYYADGTEEHPRSTVTWKSKGFEFDDTHGYVRLSKGKRQKEHRSDFILCALDLPPTFPDDSDRVDLRQVRAVWNGDEWTAHLVCTVEMDVLDSPGEKTAGVDLGICNIAAVSFGDETLLFPGGALKEDKHYFKQREYACEGENGLSRAARRAKRTLKRRRQHFHHVLSARIIAECIERNVGRLMVGKLTGIRTDDDGSGRNWGRHGNKRLHGWAFGDLTEKLEYKGEAAGIDVVVEFERNTSNTCSMCGHTDGSQRVHRGLYHCEKCGRSMNADCNGAENCRQTLLPNPDAFDRLDRDNGCLAQPVVYLFDRSEGAFASREQALGCTP